MADMFNILDGIVNSGYADETLADTRAIQDYAEACGENISLKDAERIAAVGKHWMDEQRNGNGEWSRMRHEAREALEV